MTNVERNAAAYARHEARELVRTDPQASAWYATTEMRESLRRYAALGGYAADDEEELAYCLAFLAEFRRAKRAQEREAAYAAERLEWRKLYDTARGF